MRTAAVFLILIFVGACTTAKQIVGPSGMPAYSIKCGATDSGACFEKAGEVCPKGYTILNSQESRYMGQIGDASFSGTSGFANSIPIITPNIILIECKNAQQTQ